MSSVFFRCPSKPSREHERKQSIPRGIARERQRTDFARVKSYVVATRYERHHGAKAQNDVFEVIFRMLSDSDVSPNAGPLRLYYGSVGLPPSTNQRPGVLVLLFVLFFFFQSESGSDGRQKRLTLSYAVFALEKGNDRLLTGCPSTNLLAHIHP